LRSGAVIWGGLQEKTREYGGTGITKLKIRPQHNSVNFGNGKGWRND
jgi:hypothetical protein